MAKTATIEQMLGQIPIFRHLAPKQIDLIAAAMVEQKFARGAVVIRSGSSASKLILVVEGSLRQAGAPRYQANPRSWRFHLRARLDRATPLRRQHAPGRGTDSVLHARAESAGRQGAPRRRTGRATAHAQPARSGRDGARVAGPRRGIARRRLRDRRAEPESLTGRSDQLEIYARELRDLFERERQRATELRESPMGTVRALVALCETKDPG